MKDYDIHIDGGSEVTLFGTEDDTIVVPASVKFDTDHDQADIDIKGKSIVKIGIPKQAEHIELNVKDATLKISNLTYKRIEIDAKGSLVIDLEDAEGAIDVNMVGGEAEMRVPKGYKFNVREEGKKNKLVYNMPVTVNTDNVIELNGKDSVLKIIEK